MHNMVTLKRIGLNSAFKVGAMIGLITSTLTGLLMVGLQALFVSALSGLVVLSTNSSGFSMGSASRSSADLINALGLAGLCIFYISFIVFSTIAGGLGGILWAFAYNLGARWIGGLELELEVDPGKRKRLSDLDDIYE